jgi:outer membrane receptor for ferrienterochelin and colicins
MSLKKHPARLLPAHGLTIAGLSALMLYVEPCQSCLINPVMRKSLKIILWSSLILFCSSILFPLCAADQNLDAETLYDMDLYQLMDIEVTTATRTKIKLKDSPGAVYVITEKDIRQRGYRTLEDALHDVPGFDFQHTYGIFPDLIHQRGFVGNNQRSLVYVDGIPDNNISENAILGGTIRYPLHNVERVEIVAGPVSSLYGANAFNGVINIITKDGSDGEEKKIEGFAGTWMDSDYTGAGGDFAINGRYPEGDGKLVYGVGGYYYKADGPDFRGVQHLNDKGLGYWWSDTYNNSDEDTYNVTAKFHTDRLRVEAMQWQYLQGDGTFANGANQIDTDGHGFTGSAWDFRNNLFSVGYLSDINSKLNLDSEIDVRNTELLSSSHESYPNHPGPDAYNDPEDVTTVSDYSRPDYCYELEERLLWQPNDKLDNTLGMEGTYFDVPEGYGDYQRYNYKNYATYVQSIYQMTDIISLVGGYRFDYNTSYDNANTYRVSVIGNPGDFTLKALISTGFRAPTSWEMLNETRQRKQNTSLDPEKLWSAETGIGYSFNNTGNVSLSLYYDQIKDIILEVQTDEPNPNPEIPFWNQNQNVGKADIIGMEVNSNLTVTDRLTLFANYTYSNGEYKDLPTTLIYPPTAHNGDSIPNIAEHKANAGATYTIVNGLTFHVRANYVYDRENIASNPTGETGQYILYHANIRWENAFMRGLYFQLLVRNIFDKDAFDPGIRTATGQYYPTQHPIEGRNIWGTVGYKF